MTLVACLLHTHKRFALNLFVFSAMQNDTYPFDWPIYCTFEAPFQWIGPILDLSSSNFFRLKRDSEEDFLAGDWTLIGNGPVRRHGVSFTLVYFDSKTRTRWHTHIFPWHSLFHFIIPTYIRNCEANMEVVVAVTRAPRQIFASNIRRRSTPHGTRNTFMRDCFI